MVQVEVQEDTESRCCSRAGLRSHRRARDVVLSGGEDRRAFGCRNIFAVAIGEVAYQGLAVIVGQDHRRHREHPGPGARRCP